MKDSGGGAERGIELGAAADNYNPKAIRRHLGTMILGSNVEVHAQVGSTNDIARRAGREGRAEGLVVLSEEQVHGRGRLGRTWTAPPGSSILCSVLLRPRFSPQQAFYLTIAAAVSILRAIRSLAPEDSQPARNINNIEQSPIPDLQSAIKWPNDILLNERKVAGILCESEFSGGDWAFAVIGFGINVNLRRDEFGPLREQATSISAELGRAIDRARLLARVLDELEVCYLSLQNGQNGHIFRAWQDALATLGKSVTVRDPAGEVNGIAVRVDPDGALVVKSRGGEEKRVLAGDVGYPAG